MKHLSGWLATWFFLTATLVSAGDTPERQRLLSVANGQADASGFLQAALDAGKGSLNIPRGRYRLDKSLVVKLADSEYCQIMGDGPVTLIMNAPGPAIRLVGTHERSADPAGFAPGVWLNERMPIIERLAVEGQHAEAVGIEARGTMAMTVSRVHLRKLKHGIHLAGSNRNVLIDACHIYENKGIGIYYDNVNLHQSNIVGCHISYCDGGGIVSRKGNVRNIHISGCDIESNMSRDTEPTANVLIDCRESSAGTAEVAISGCTLQHNSEGPDSCNIRILGRSQTAQGMPNREGHVAITGNVLSDVATNVHLNNCRGVTLTGNTFWMGYQHNLLVEESSHIVIGPNSFDRNPRYGYGTALKTTNVLLLRNCEDCTLSGLHIAHVWNSPAGLVLENCRRMNISGSTILDCDNAGILAKNVSDSLISGCLISQADKTKKFTPILVEGGSGNKFQ
ncbi:MAG: right-handed parallel beta-helix repeat-containing protein [Pirellulaceae bacterium]|nr:right-handed parallel beta-helix repeat-containing protein [Pirellulaceae bacterium]